MSHPSTWPANCPACNYSWQGLPQPRCPECGETLADDEILLIADRLTARTAFFLRGRPKWVLRLSPRGFQFGAGTRMRTVYSWKNIRLEIRLSPPGKMEVRAYYLLGDMPLLLAFEFKLVCERYFALTFLQHVESWKLPNAHFPSMSQVVPIDATLVPTECPVCHYSWAGLPTARCPECGESISPYEIVLTADPHYNRIALSTGEHLGRDLLQCAAAAILVGFIFILLRGAEAKIIYITITTFALFFIAVLVSALYHRARGVPAHILRISSEGLRFGAGSTMGPLIAWSPRHQFDLSYNGYLRLALFRMHGTKRVWRSFTFYIACEPAFADSLFQKLNGWNAPYFRDGKPPPIPQAED